jgi:hypothetical protein
MPTSNDPTPLAAALAGFDAIDKRMRAKIRANPNRTPPPRWECPICLENKGWVPGNPTNGWPTIAPCPRCNKVTHDLWENGAYKLDAPSTRDNPRNAAILNRHGINGR